MSTIMSTIQSINHFQPSSASLLSAHPSKSPFLSPTFPPFFRLHSYAYLPNASLQQSALPLPLPSYRVSSRVAGPITAGDVCDIASAAIHQSVARIRTRSSEPYPDPVVRAPAYGDSALLWRVTRPRGAGGGVYAPSVGGGG